MNNNNIQYNTQDWQSLDKQPIDIGIYLVSSSQSYGMNISQSTILEKNGNKKQDKDNSIDSDERKHLNHNSQKHTVVSIKTLLSIDSFCQDSDQHILLRKIWKIFKNQKTKKTKQLLIVLFGSENISEEKQKKLFERYGFQEILEEPKFLLEKVQHLLREAAIKQITPAVIKKHVEARRMSQKQQYKQYLESFVQQLKNGPMKGRITREKFNSQKLEASLSFQEQHLDCYWSQ